MDKKTIVIGHKNPDTDSICSAIAYAHLKSKISKGSFVPCKAGSVSPETKFVLKYFEVSEPQLIEDVRPQISDLKLIVEAFVSKDTSVEEAMAKCEVLGTYSLAVVEDSEVVGIVSKGDMAKKVLSLQNENENIEEILKSYAKLTVGEVMTGEAMTFFLEDYVEDATQRVLETRFREFPIVDKKCRYEGLLRREELANTTKKDVVLVDHNEREQAVNGIESATILEIVDHHKIGNILTDEPIFYQNLPVGCTSTIVYDLYKKNNEPIPKSIAGLMCSAIISDTLLFRSPTCTAKDEEACRDLASIANLDIEKYAFEMFSAGSDFASKSIDDIFYLDYKTFKIGDVSYGVGQISSVNKRELDEIKPKLLKYMNKKLKTLKEDMIFMMLTDIMNESSDFLCAGENSLESAMSAFIGFEPIDDSSIFLEGVVSRKKQIIPRLAEVFVS